MKEKNKVLIKINGQEYPIVGAEPKEHLLKVGSFVDDKMEAVAKSNKTLSTSMIAVLTSINIADQYLKTKSSYEEIEKHLEQPKEEIKELESHIETLNNQLKEKDQEYSNLQEKIEEIQANQEDSDQEILLKEKLLEKDQNLEKAQDLINDLQNKLFANQIKLVEAINELDECRRKSDFRKK